MEYVALESKSTERQELITSIVEEIESMMKSSEFGNKPGKYVHRIFGKDWSWFVMDSTPLQARVFMVFGPYKSGIFDSPHPAEMIFEMWKTHYIAPEDIELAFDYLWEQEELNK